jgi:non-ribosomal peptide synthetase component F
MLILSASEGSGEEIQSCWDLCDPQLVAKQATVAPDAVAIVADDQVFSYREINRRANRPVHYLQALGMRSKEFGTVLKVCMNRFRRLISRGYRCSGEIRRPDRIFYKRHTGMSYVDLP